VFTFVVPYDKYNFLPQSQIVHAIIQDLVEAGFYEIKGTGKGSHRKYTHALYPGAVTISGKSGEDSKRYQEKQVRQAIEEVKK